MKQWRPFGNRILRVAARIPAMRLLSLHKFSLKANQANSLRVTLNILFPHSMICGFLNTRY